MTTLNPELQKNLVASLELGLTSIGVDTVYTLCCDFIQVFKEIQQTEVIFSC